MVLILADVAILQKRRLYSSSLDFYLAQFDQGHRDCAHCPPRDCVLAHQEFRSLLVLQEELASGLFGWEKMVGEWPEQQAKDGVMLKKRNSGAWVYFQQKKKEFVLLLGWVCWKERRSLLCG